MSLALRCMLCECRGVLFHFLKLKTAKNKSSALLSCHEPREQRRCVSTLHGREPAGTRRTCPTSLYKTVLKRNQTKLLYTTFTLEKDGWGQGGRCSL